MLTGYVQNLERYKEDKYGPHARVTRSRELSHLEDLRVATRPILSEGYMCHKNQKACCEARARFVP